MAERLLLDSDDQEQVGLYLFDQGLFGVREDPADYIRLKSGRLSPHYFDIRQGVSDWKTRRVVSTTLGALMSRRAVQENSPDLRGRYDYVAGNPEAMTSYAASLADHLKIGLLQPRVDQAKSTGNKTPILGRYQRNEAVALVDDVVTDGGSKEDMIRKMNESGLDVIDYFVVLDREEGGRLQVRQNTGLEIVPALSVSAMVHILEANNRLSGAQTDNVHEYMKQYGDPEARQVLGIIS